MADAEGATPDGGATTEDRDHAGRFKPGNKGGPGRKVGGWVARRQRLIEDCVSDDMARELINQTFRDAIDHVEAAVCIGSRRLLWPYLFGTAPEAHEVEDEDAERVGRVILNIVKR